MSSHDLTIYVQVEPEWSGYVNANGDKTVWGLKLANATLRRPTKPKPGTVLTKLTLRIPDAAFMPLRPEAVIVVPEDMTTVNPIEVEAGDPA